MTQPAIAAAMGVSLSIVNRAHMDFDHGGIKALKPKLKSIAAVRPKLEEAILYIEHNPEKSL
jgi:hypothetical protein